MDVKYLVSNTLERVRLALKAQYIRIKYGNKSIVPNP